jgi:hypothetical protein
MGRPSLSWLVLLFACGGAGHGRTGPLPPPGEGAPRDESAVVEVEHEDVPERAPGGSAGAPGDPATFGRDQPTVSRLFRWNGTLVVQADIFYTMDVAAGTVAALSIPGADEVLALATMGQVPLALCRAGHDRKLLSHSGATWTELPLPDDARASGEHAVMAGDASSLVILDGHKVRRLRGTSWTSVSMAAPPREVTGVPRHLVLDRDHLYVGWDEGEWGGALFVLDVGTGHWGAGPEDGTPVHDLAVDSSGAVWAALGLAHLGGIKGSLWRKDASGWTRVASTSDARDTGSTGWNLPPDSFEAITFDAQGDPLLLTGTMGIVRRESGGTWTQRTRRWPASHYLYVRGLALEGNVAVIASLDAGIWLWDLDHEEVRRIPLRG